MSSTGVGPRYSVVVPAYQAAGVIGTCVEALIRQTLQRGLFEIIVVDDGSTDHTAVVARTAGADQVLTVPHRGPAAARNAGIGVARGEIILFTDADCEPLPDWLAEMVRSCTVADVSGVKGTYRTKQHEVVARLAQCEFEERYDRLQSLAAIDFIDTYAAAFRASALRDVGVFDIAFPYANNEDVDLSYRMARAGCRFVFNRQAAVYHHHAASWRAYLRLKLRRGYWRMVVYRRYPEKAVQDSYTPQLLKVQVLLVYLVPALGLGMCIAPLLGWAVGVALIALVVSTLPFVRLVATLDRSLVAWAPLFVCARAAAFAVGIIGGLLGMVVFPPAGERSLRA